MASKLMITVNGLVDSVTASLGTPSITQGAAVIAQGGK